MGKHIHAEVMKQYAEDAMETTTPWERWQIASKWNKTKWETCTGHPLWNENTLYRRRPIPRYLNVYEHKDGYIDIAGTWRVGGRLLTNSRCIGYLLDKQDGSPIEFIPNETSSNEHNDS